jgi:hypothetical protein
MTTIASALLGQNESSSHRLTMWATDEHTTAGTIRVAIAHGRPSLRTRLRIPLQRAGGGETVAPGVLLGRTNPSNLVRAVTVLGRGRPLRPRRFLRERHIQEEAMLTPKVIEMRRGSAHAAPALNATAATRRRRA